jgi:hypothetical protein
MVYEDVAGLNGEKIRANPSPPILAEAVAKVALVAAL